MLVGAVALIVFVGYIPVPTYPRFAEAPDPAVPGIIAFSIPSAEERDREFEERCLHTATPGTGAEIEVRCRHGIGWAVAWSRDGRIVTEDFTGDFSAEFEGPALLVFDPVPDGSFQLGRYDGEPDFLWSDRRRRRADGARVDAEDEGPRVVVRTDDGAVRVLLEPERAPANYRYYEPQWSPNGRFVLVADTEGRLIILTADGDPRPRTLVDTDVSEHGLSAAWYIEGNPTYTVDPDRLNTG